MDVFKKCSWLQLKAANGLEIPYVSLLRNSFSQFEAVKVHIKQLLDSQVITESCSPYATPIVLVTKKEGSLRMFVDYGQLNSRTHKDAYPLPRIEESLDTLTSAKWFSKIRPG